jgi:hypothetical protein
MFFKSSQNSYKIAKVCVYFLPFESLYASFGCLIQFEVWNMTLLIGPTLIRSLVC